MPGLSVKLAEHIDGVNNRLFSRWSIYNSYKNKFFQEIGAQREWEVCVGAGMFEF